MFQSYSAYSLYVSGSDLNGAAGALSGQCGADIKILDVNDNFPVLEFDSVSSFRKYISQECIKKVRSYFYKLN